MLISLKFLFYFLVASAIFLFLPKEVFGQVVINEFSSNNGTDWVEVYNTSGELINLSGSYYQLRDTSPSGNPKNLDCLLPSSGHFSVDWGNNLNNDGDRIVLLKGEQVIDCVAYGNGNGSVCEGKAQVDLGKLDPGEYGVRDPEGSGGWVKTTSQTKAGNSECLIPTSTPAPEPTATPTPTPGPINTPTPTPKPSTSTPTPKPTTSFFSTTSTPTQKLTPTPTPTPTGEILGVEVTSSPTMALSPTPTPTAPIAQRNLRNLLPKIFIGTGFLFLVGSVMPFVLTKLKRDGILKKDEEID